MQTSTMGSAVVMPEWIVRVFEYCRAHIQRRPPRRLRLCESLSLGDKRVLAVVQFDQARYLVGASGTTITLLSRLPNAGGAAPGQGKEESCGL